jgi:hypothetical protein
MALEPLVEHCRWAPPCLPFPFLISRIRRFADAIFVVVVFQSPNPEPLSLIPEVLFLVEQIRPRTAQVYDLGAPISVLLQSRALEAVERVGNSFTAADDALVLVVAKGALVADAHKCGRSYVRVADGTFAVALVAEAADGDAACLAAHDEIGMMARHSGGIWKGDVMCCVGSDVVYLVVFGRLSLKNYCRSWLEF